LPFISIIDSARILCINEQSVWIVAACWIFPLRRTSVLHVDGHALHRDVEEERRINNDLKRLRDAKTTPDDGINNVTSLTSRESSSGLEIWCGELSGLVSVWVTRPLKCKAVLLTQHSITCMCAVGDNVFIILFLIILNYF
jgi:hypothetical protein